MYIRGLYLSVLLSHMWSVSCDGEVGLCFARTNALTFGVCVRVCVCVCVCERERECVCLYVHHQRLVLI